VSRWALVCLLLACKQRPTEIAPAPEPSRAPKAPAPDIEVARVQCTYGGTAPAFFVWFDLTTRVPLHKLRARSLLIAGADAGFADAVERRLGHGILQLRTRVRNDGGVGDVGVVPPQIAAGERVQLELFGPLNLALFGTATYPTEDRPFRAELEADGIAPVTFEGTCIVGPAG
jgi:hypothetical protein